MSATDKVEVDASKKAAEPEKVTEEEGAAEAVDEEEEQTNLIVNYLPQYVSEDKLREMFAKFGELEHVKLMLDKVTQSSMGYGFVKYAKPECAAAAINALNGFQMDSKKLRVGYSHPRSEANVYVGNLKPSVSKEQLEGLFRVFGPIVECKILIDHETSQSKGCGFVKFENVNHAKDAINGLNGMNIPEYSVRPLTVKFARKQEKNHRNRYPAGGYRNKPFNRPQHASSEPHESAPVEYSGYCLFVYNLPPDANNDTLKSLFSRFGNITSANIMFDANHCCRGYGFVNFEKKEEAEHAIKEMNGFIIKNRALSVSFKSDKRH